MLPSHYLNTTPPLPTPVPVPIPAPVPQVILNFTPHLMPMSRGILETIYVKLAPGKTAADLKTHLANTYKSEPFVHVLEGYVTRVALFRIFEGMAVELE